MIEMTLASAALALALGAAAAGGGSRVPLAPTGKWIVEYHPDLCVATHAFGDAGLTVGFRPWPMGDRIEYVLLRPGKRGDPRRGAATVTLGGVGTVARGDYVDWMMPKSGSRITVVTVDSAATERLSEATSIAIVLDRAAPITVAPDRMKAALAALKTCNDDLLRTWGLDPDEHLRVATPASASAMADWITDADYPSAMSENDAQGTTTIAWTIETDGRVRTCRVVSTSGHVELDTAACAAIVKRARYKPAIGLDGKAMVTHGIRRVVWQMES